MKLMAYFTTEPVEASCANDMTSHWSSLPVSVPELLPNLLSPSLSSRLELFWTREETPGKKRDRGFVWLCRKVKMIHVDGSFKKKKVVVGQ